MSNGTNLIELVERYGSLQALVGAAPPGSHEQAEAAARAQGALARIAAQVNAHDPTTLRGHGVDAEGVWRPLPTEHIVNCLTNSLQRAVELLRATGQTGDFIDAARLLWLKHRRSALASLASIEKGEQA